MGIVIDAYRAYKMEFDVHEEIEKEVYDMFVKNDSNEVYEWIKKELTPMIPYKEKSIRSTAWQRWENADRHGKNRKVHVTLTYKVSKSSTEVWF